MNYTIDTILQDLKPQMKPERYNHTIGVIFTAANLAYAHHCDSQKAMLAAALHDCAKITSISDYISECKRLEIPIPEYTYESPHLLHAQIGAKYASTKYKVYDEEVIHAIHVHTTGCPNMTLLDKILYLADYIEPGRYPYHGIDKLRYKAYHDLDYAVYLEADNVLEYIKSKGFTQDPRTKETRDFYLDILNRRN